MCVCAEGGGGGEAVKGKRQLVVGTFLGAASRLKLHVFRLCFALPREGVDISAVDVVDESKNNELFQAVVPLGILPSIVYLVQSQPAPSQ